MPSKTGYWSQEEANTQHVFSYRLCDWISKYLSKSEPVIDLGAGLGTYAGLLSRLGFQTVKAVEGTELSNIDCDSNDFVVADLTEPLELYLQGNVLCLEVCEHVAQEYESKLLENIVKHVAPGGKLILSWAVPGQGGHGHVNCRDNLYVISQMEGRGFEFLVNDSVFARSVIEDHCSWFRNTIMIFQK